MSKMGREMILLMLGVVISYASAYPAIQNHGHMQKRQSYGRSNQLPAAPHDSYGQPSYNSYDYYRPRSHSSPPGNGGGYYNANGFGQPAPSGHGQYYPYPPSQYYGRGDPIQGSYASVNPIQRELTVRNGQLRQKEYQQRTGQEGRDTYDPFYFYVNPVAAGGGGGAGIPLPPPSPSDAVGVPVSSPSSPTTATAALHQSREHIVGGPPRNRRNSLNSRDPYFDNEISRDKYEILKPSYPRSQNNVPQAQQAFPQNGRYSSGRVGQGHYHQPVHGNSNQFLNYEQIVGAEPPRYASASGTPPRGQPWSIQIGTQLKVNDDGKGGNSGSRFYVRDERNTRPRHPPYRK